MLQNRATLNQIRFHLLNELRQRYPENESESITRLILEHARRSGMRIVGPNCLGVMMPRLGLNATFAKGIARPGNVAFISQSGALCTAVLDWSLQHNVGFSAFVSIGGMADVGPPGM